MSPVLRTKWDDVAKGDLIPEGRHLARIDKVEEKVSEKSGKSYWAVTYTLQDEPYTGRQVWGNCSLEPRALWKLRMLAESIGIDLTGRDDLDADELVNQEVGIVITHETYEGKERVRVDDFFKV